MSEPFIGQIKLWGGNFAPRGYAFCNGQLLAIAQNTALFSILGTIYGGDGRSTFALPNLQGRVPIHAGHGPGLSVRTLGQTGGSDSVTLSEAQVPPHTHPPRGIAGQADTQLPANNTSLAQPPAGRGSPGVQAYGPANNLVAMNTVAFEPAGGSQPHVNAQPRLALSYIIALQGIFPSRS